MPAGPLVEWFACLIGKRYFTILDDYNRCNISQKKINHNQKQQKTSAPISLNISVFSFPVLQQKTPSISKSSQIEKPGLGKICSFKPATAYILHTRDMLGQGISLSDRKKLATKLVKIDLHKNSQS